MIVEIRETEYLAEIEGVPVVIKTTEHLLFGKWVYKTEELHSYNQALINAFRVQPEPKPSNPMGFQMSNKQPKKRKRNENKSKTN